MNAVEGDLIEQPHGIERPRRGRGGELVEEPAHHALDYIPFFSNGQGADGLANRLGIAQDRPQRKDQVAGALTQG